MELTTSISASNGQKLQTGIRLLGVAHKSLCSIPPIAMSAFVSWQVAQADWNLPPLDK